MNKFKKIFLIGCLTIVLSTSFNSGVQAAGLFGFNDPAGCESKDPFLPNLLICGRSPSTGACQAYTKPCNLGDLVQTGSRAVVWIITMVLLITPLFVMYYGAMMIIQQTWPTGAGIDKLIYLKKRFWTILIYFILMLAAWLIVRTVIDIFKVNENVPTFLIDENGQKVQARPFNTNN